MTKNNADLSFEESLSTLEAIVSELEKGDISLDDALKQFEHGITLVRHSQSKLDQAQQRVSILLNEKPDDKLVPFENEGE
ncbi:exodeoxyribonuclease VII small subunit [Parashewanella spongiae]|uniref:Exodeoxyribonuclease 7 small subunit n=1 Tax=Parashewanella spongiae TaxID=342950 RepID=A0A3A6TJA0_9GAMM|nr:exodeoxyribonuclease VII small subunit [Parashewanella spongiae]MCL1078782.1 exodeoxyribonuclease VII small subunit [Parashewanella spongiae]RJY12216.1 exodeoxyribonuclease VII small subunit [Parashewanella spongiae]